MDREDDIIGMRVSLLSPERIREISVGEVSNGQTIDTVSGRPVEGGLFCQQLFGPVDRGVCACGNYFPHYRKRKTICKKCKVDVVDPVVRRQRVGRIELSSSVVHIWYRRAIAVLLAIPPRKLDLLIECRCHMILEKGQSSYKTGEIISSADFYRYMAEHPEDKRFKGHNGGNVIKKLLKEVDLPKLVHEIRKTPPSRRVNRRLMLARDFLESGVKPEWMVLDVIPVLPPDLRPVLIMDDGTMASSDINELYARVIHRNERLKRAGEHTAMDSLLNIYRMGLQQAVDALMYNGKRYVAKDRTGKKVLKSLSDLIETKEGRIRRNLLGKRVDYSGRSVIVVGPTLKLHQCGLPLELAMDIFRPFVYSYLRRAGYAASLKHARALVDARSAAAMEALEYVVSERTVLINRAPSLHRMSMQAFDPVIHRERAIRLHPLVCSAFNADFDGDQMGVHIPVTIEAQIEARTLMLSVYNILSPASGKLSVAPSQDIILGVYYLTKDRGKQRGEGMVFSDPSDAQIAYDNNVIDLHARIKVRVEGEIRDTTVGRLIFHDVLPPQLPFSTVDKTIRKKDLGKIIELSYEKVGQGETVRLLDRINEVGFKFATLGGISLCVSDVTIPKEKEMIIEETEERVKEIKETYRNSLISEEEKHNQIVDLWKKASAQIAEKMMDSLGVPDSVTSEEDRRDYKEFNSMFMMADSGARGSKEQIRQLAGMRGLMAKPTGEIVEIPIKSNFREGLTYFEYLLACHGARKGRADGALKTANAGYFTRRLVDACHDVVINAVDCGAIGGVTFSALLENDDIVIPLEDRIVGRVLAKNVRDPQSGLLIGGEGSIVTKGVAEQIREAGISSVTVRSPLSCRLKTGICAKCYGLDPSTRRLPVIGDAAGIIAAQSIGEPGTQLTLRTFHSGGTAAGSGAKNQIVAKVAGTATFMDVRSIQRRDKKSVVINRSARLAIISAGKKIDAGGIPYGSVLYIDDGDTVEAGSKLAEWDPFSSPVICAIEGEAKLEGLVEGKTLRREMNSETGIEQLIVSAITTECIPKIVVDDKVYPLPIGAIILTEDHACVGPGDILAKVPKTAAKNIDITGGLSRVLQVLEVRGLKDPAIIADIDGEVTIRNPRGKRILVEIKNESGLINIYSVPIERQLNVYNGDYVRAGDLIVDGVMDPRDVARVLGAEAAALYIINEVQKVYRGQGVDMNDKHLEIVVRKMMAKVLIVDPGDTRFVTDEIVGKNVFSETNRSVDGRKAIARSLVLSLTRAATMSDSWLSAASFQETTRILAEAAIRAAVDPLLGSKENIIVGKMVPIGTGHKRYRDTFVLPEKVLAAMEEEKKRLRLYNELLGVYKEY